MSAAGSEGRAAAAPRESFLIPTDVVAVALIAQAASENNIVFDAFDLEATLAQVAAGLRFGVLPHVATLLLPLPF
jgi:hypothetical protein